MLMSRYSHFNVSSTLTPNAMPFSQLQWKSINETQPLSYSSDAHLPKKNPSVFLN